MAAADAEKKLTIKKETKHEGDRANNYLSLSGSPLLSLRAARTNSAAITVMKIIWESNSRAEGSNPDIFDEYLT